MTPPFKTTTIFDSLNCRCGGPLSPSTIRSIRLTPLVGCNSGKVWMYEFVDIRYRSKHNPVINRWTRGSYDEKSTDNRHYGAGRLLPF